MSSSVQRIDRESVVTGIVVGLIALVVWLFAEAQGVVEQTIETRVTFQRAPNQAVRVEDPAWNGAVSVRLSGPRAAIEIAASALGRDEIRRTLITAGASERQTVDLRTVLRESDVLRDSPVSVQSVEPETVIVQVDALVSRENIPIRVELPDVELEGDPEVEPQTATLILPQELNDQLVSSNTQLTLVARPDASELLDAEEGERVRVVASLLKPDGLAENTSVTVAPQNVTVSVTIRRRLDTASVPFVPVWVLLPPAEMDRWRIRIAPESVGLQDLTITGPSDIIDQIRRQELPVVAVVRLTDVELESRIDAKMPTFPELPDSCQVSGVDTPIRLIIEPRLQAPDAAGGGR